MAGSILHESLRFYLSCNIIYPILLSIRQKVSVCGFRHFVDGYVRSISRDFIFDIPENAQKCRQSENKNSVLLAIILHTLGVLKRWDNLAFEYIRPGATLQTPS
jgi:hypothetical protein